MEALVLTIGMLAAVYWIAEQLCPLPMRIAKRIGQHLWRGTATLAWRVPARRWGIAMTVLGWSALLATVCTIMAVVNPKYQSTALVGFAWFLVAVIWLVVRWSAQRRFAAQPLPRRPQR